MRFLRLDRDLKGFQDFDAITELLLKMDQSYLEEVAVHFLAKDGNIFFRVSRGETAYAEACGKLDKALSRFPRVQLSFLVPYELQPIRRLWTQEFRRVFPARCDRGEVTVTCELSESELTLAVI